MGHSDRRPQARLVGCALVLGVTLATAFAFRPPAPESEAPEDRRRPRADRGEMVTDMRTSVVRDGRLQVRVSAKAVRRGHVRALGPLRIGFLPSIQADDVVVERFDAAEAAPEEEALESIVPALAAGMDLAAVVQAEIRGFTYKHHGADGSLTMLKARVCRAERGALVCRMGSIEEDGRRRYFKEIFYENGKWGPRYQAYAADRAVFEFP